MERVEQERPAQAGLPLAALPLAALDLAEARPRTAEAVRQRAARPARAARREVVADQRAGPVAGALQQVV